MNKLDELTVQFSTTPWHTEQPVQWLPPKHVVELIKIRWQNRWSWVIRKMTHSPFSHMDFVLDDGSLLGASDMGKNSLVIQGNPCGVAIRPSNYQNPWGRRRQMRIKTDKADDIIAAALTQLNKPFDNAALYKFIGRWPHNRDWRDPNKWFCAELCTWATEAGNYWNKKLIWPKNRVSPTDYLLIFLTDPNFINADTFWDPIPGLTLSPGER